MSMKNKIFKKAKELNLNLDKVRIDRLNEAQLREICVGLYYGIDVTKFSFSCIPAANMRQLRLMELSGFDCTPYRLYFSEKQLEQIYLGMISKVDYNLYNKIYIDSEDMKVLREDLTAKLTKQLVVSYYETMCDKGSDFLCITV